jgi:hypothetical protein
MPLESNQPRPKSRKKKKANRSNRDPCPPNTTGYDSVTSATSAGITTSNAPESHAASESSKTKLEPIPKRTKLETAVSKLKKTAAKLGQLLPEDLRNGEIKMDSIRGYSDLNTLADNVSAVMETMMDQRSTIEESKKRTAKTFLKTWAKKALPFIEQGLSVATVYFSDHFLSNPHKRMPFRLRMV